MSLFSGVIVALVAAAGTCIVLWIGLVALVLIALQAVETARSLIARFRAWRPASPPWAKPIGKKPGGIARDWDWDWD